MALWQYGFFVLPKSSYSEIALEKDDDSLFDDSIFWKRTGFTSEDFSIIEKLLPRVKSWNKNLIIYGNLESNVFEILTDESGILSVSLRIDLRSSFDEILASLIDFFIIEDLVIIDQNLEFISLDLKLIKTKIKNSQQIAILDYLVPDLLDQIYYVDKGLIEAIEVGFTFLDNNAWYELYQRNSDQTFWRLDKYDRLQERFFVMLPSMNEWNTFDSRELQIALLSKTRGFNIDFCVWNGCQRLALNGLAYCQRHAYFEMGIRK